MKTATLEAIQKAHDAIDWSGSTCAKESRQDSAIARLFDEPALHPDRAEVARSMCLRCPILETCLGYALEYETPLEVNPLLFFSDTLMGGFSLDERRKLKVLPAWREAFGLSQ